MLEIINLIHELPQHPTKKYLSRDLSKIDQIIVHHSADNSQDPKLYAKMHIGINDWPAIGYHFMIDKTGCIYQTNSEDTLCFHCKGQNRRSLGVCIMGNYSKELLPIEVSSALLDLIEYLKLRFIIAKVKKHNDYAKTECPGINFKLF